MEVNQRVVDGDLRLDDVQPYAFVELVVFDAGEEGISLTGLYDRLDHILPKEFIRDSVTGHVTVGIFDSFSKQIEDHVETAYRLDSEPYKDMISFSSEKLFSLLERASPRFVHTLDQKVVDTEMPAEPTERELEYLDQIEKGPNARLYEELMKQEGLTGEYYLGIKPLFFGFRLSEDFIITKYG